MKNFITWLVALNFFLPILTSKDPHIQMDANKSEKCLGSLYPAFNAIRGYDIHVVRAREAR